jgi:hypothetical protein
MLEIGGFALLVALFGAGFLMGLLAGYNKGVRETEARWHGAVERAADARLRNRS